MNNKNYFFRKKHNTILAYLLPLLLSLWGIGNVLYWEVYKGYSACNFCKWHRGCYIALFISLLTLFKFKSNFFKLLAWLFLITEVIVSILQVFRSCNPLICRYVSSNEKLNLSFALATLILLFIFEIFSYVNHRKKKIVI